MNAQIQGDEMTVRVTDYFHIATKPVEFVDVDVYDDNRLYVDPSAIRWAAKHGDTWATAAYGSLGLFFDELLARITNPARGSGLSMCTSFHEPSETRLGMSEKGFYGSCTSDQIGALIWTSVSTNPLCLLSVPVFRRVEHLALFVDDIAEDRVSDITTRIIFSDLARFTSEQMVKHPEFGSGETVKIDPIWDSTTNSWSEQTFTLPCVHGGTRPHAPLLLVPNRIVYPSLRMSPDQYHDLPVLEALQAEKSWVDGEGKVRKPTKVSLNQRDEYKPIRPVNQRITEAALRDGGENLLEQYERYVDDNFEPLDYWAALERLRRRDQAPKPSSDKG